MPRIRKSKIYDAIYFLVFTLGSLTFLKAGYWMLSSQGAIDESIVSEFTPSAYVSLFAWSWTAILLISYRRVIRETKFTPDDWIIAYTAASLLWSQSPTDSAPEFFKIILLSLLAKTLRNKWTTDAITIQLIRLSIYILLASTAVSLLLPSYGLGVGAQQDIWQGIFIHKNQLGAFCGLSIILAIGCLVEKKHAKLALISLSLGTIGLFQSRSVNAVLSLMWTAWLAFGLITYLYSSRSVTKGIALIFFLSLSSILIFSATLSYESILGKLGKDVTFTGRSSIWAQAAEAISTRPFQGFGISTYWSLYPSYVKLGESYIIPHAHNGYLELVLDLGIPGLLIFTIFISSHVKQALKRKNNSPPSLSVLLITLYVIILNLGTSALVGSNFYFFILLLVYGSRSSKNESSQFDSQIPKYQIPSYNNIHQLVHLPDSQKEINANA